MTIPYNQLLLHWKDVTAYITSSSGRELADRLRADLSFINGFTQIVVGRFDLPLVETKYKESLDSDVTDKYSEESTDVFSSLTTQIRKSLGCDRVVYMRFSADLDSKMGSCNLD